MLTLDALKEWFENEKEEIVKNYFHFLRFPSISADPAYAKDCVACANWLVDFLQKRGLSSELIDTPSLPIVYGSDLSAGKNKPTLLIYGHYDVQPIDPIELWKSPPFEPTIRDGSVYARGAVDDKGQIFYALMAILCWKDLGHSLPVNIKFCIEGEEEYSSKGLSDALPKLGSKFQADYLLVVDFDAFGPEEAAISLGGRGMVALELTLRGSAIDLHSGLYGGIAYNPNRAMAELLAKLYDENGRVQVPGFYDGIIDPSPDDLKTLECRHDKDYYTKHFGIEAFGGEKGKSLHESNCFYPTLEINGIVGGYTGAGIKTVIPATSHAKITCRLVPGQDPEKISKGIVDFLQKHATKVMRVEIKKHKGDPAFRGKVDSPLAKAIDAAAQEATGNPCHYLISGGSIPIVPALLQASKGEFVGMGYGLIDDAIHAPNERFDMRRFELGFLTLGRALSLL